MTLKRTPRQPILPQWRGSASQFAIALLENLRRMWQGVRDDFDNGASTFQYKELTHIADVPTSDFDEWQIRFYKDTTTGYVYLCTYDGTAIKKVQVT